jgi:hypothetical protein
LIKPVKLNPETSYIHVAAKPIILLENLRAACLPAWAFPYYFLLFSNLAIIVCLSLKKGPGDIFKYVCLS